MNNFLFLFVAFNIFVICFAQDECVCTPTNGMGADRATAEANARCDFTEPCPAALACPIACTQVMGSFSCTAPTLAGEQWVCTPECGNGFNPSVGVCGATGTGVGDPHFAGFDGSRFDFHGEDNHNYIVFARKWGDLLAAKVRATPELYKGIKKTYFSEFGLQMFHSKKTLHVYLEQAEVQRWKLGVKLDGKVLVKDYKSKDLTISYMAGDDQLIVNTPQNKFKIHGLNLRNRVHRHVDFDVTIKKKSTIGHLFTGILGMTLSRKLGSKIHNKVFKHRRSVSFEKEMRQYYEVASLFPHHRRISHMYKTSWKFMKFGRKFGKKNIQ